MCSVFLPHDAVGWSAVVVLAFPGHSHLLVDVTPLVFMLCQNRKSFSICVFNIVIITIVRICT